MPCAFCGSHATLTREHLWPQWVGGMLRLSGTARHTQRFWAADKPSKVNNFDARPFTTKVRAVCASCNNGWMSRLEEKMKDLASGMVVGRGRTLHQHGQATLATWAAVKVLLAEHLVPAALRFVPEEHYVSLYGARTSLVLPSTMSVWTAAYGGGVRPAFYDRTGLDLHATERMTQRGHVFQGYAAAFTVGTLALKVFGHTVPEPVQLIHQGPIAQAIRQVAPYSGSFTWPPGPSLTEAGLDRFAVGILRRSP